MVLLRHWPGTRYYVVLYIFNKRHFIAWDCNFAIIEYVNSKSMHSMVLVKATNLPIIGYLEGVALGKSQV